MKMDRLAKKYMAVINPTAKLFNSMGVIALVVMMALTAADVILRYVFSKPRVHTN